MQTYPIMYTSKEGGPWKPWTFGPIDNPYRTLMPNEQGLAEINGIIVHSFLLAIRWDFINGLEEELYVYKIPFDLVGKSERSTQE